MSYTQPRRQKPNPRKRFWCRIWGHEWGLCRHQGKVRERCARCGDLKP